MDFLDSYYSILVTKNGIEKTEIFNDTSMPIQFNREAAVSRFFQVKEEIALDENINSYRIDFIFWEHTTTRDFDNGNSMEFDRLQKNILFSIINNTVSINHINWACEAELGNQFRALFFNKEVSITNDKGKEFWVYDDKICNRLGIDFTYHIGD